jgi:hypothetical protein
MFGPYVGNALFHTPGKSLGRHHAERHARAHDHNADLVADGSENVIVARQLPTTMGWLCTRGGCGMAFAELARLQAHAESHTPPTEWCVHTIS